MDRFADAKHAASYAGLVPATYHSGDREATAAPTKRGSAELRAIKKEAAHQASRPIHPLHPYFAKLCAKRGYKMATIAVAHRLARIAFAMLRDGTDFDLRKLNVEEGPFGQLEGFRCSPPTSPLPGASTSPTPFHNERPNACLTYSPDGSGLTGAVRPRAPVPWAPTFAR